MAKKKGSEAKPADKAPVRKSDRAKPKKKPVDHGGAGGDKKPAPEAEVYDERKSIPKRDKNGHLRFEDQPDFQPNLTPKEVLQMGSFGGTYFRDIKSSVTGQSYKGKEVIKEFPDDWFEGLDIKTQVCSSTYDESLNRYKVKSGTDLCDWEKSGWISNIDPYGWFMWYCRYYLGRRSSDDERQLGRAARCFGPTGRWRIRIYNMIGRKKAAWDDPDISPVIRQTLQHWGYTLNEHDYKEHMKHHFKG